MPRGRRERVPNAHGGIRVHSSSPTQCGVTVTTLRRSEAPEVPAFHRAGGSRSRGTPVSSERTDRWSFPVAHRVTVSVHGTLRPSRGPSSFSMCSFYPGHEVQATSTQVREPLQGARDPGTDHGT